MYTRLFFENLWESEQRNELFVCMPFDFDKKFKKIKEIAVKTSFDNAKWTKEERGAKSLTTKILDGIANSRMLLFDLSDDPKHQSEKCLEKVNGNVLYELGTATAMREEEDILLIREGDAIDPKKLPFDIRELNINLYEKDLEDEWLESRLRKLLDEQDWAKSKRVEVASRLVDGEGIDLMYKFGRYPEGYNHFGTRGMLAEYKMSALRLIDLGIIRTQWICYEKGFEYAYHWTPFGHAVMKHLGIKELSIGEFKKTPQYQEHLNFLERYKKFKREMKG